MWVPDKNACQRKKIPVIGMNFLSPKYVPGQGKTNMVANKQFLSQEGNFSWKKKVFDIEIDLNAFGRKYSPPPAKHQ